MSTPILPFLPAAPGATQVATQYNDLALRNQILNGLVISDSTDAQPGSPANGDIYIITGAATGTQWATFDEFDLAIFDSGTWYAFAPVEGIIVNLAGAANQWDGAAYVAVTTGGASVSIAIQYTADTASQADSDPGAGLLRWNNATQASATQLLLDDTTSDGVSLTALWAALDAGGFIFLQHATDQDTWQIWEITGVVDATGYAKLTVSLIANGGSFANADPMLVQIEQGATAGAVSSVNGNTGAVIVLAPIGIAVSDETTALTTGTAKTTLRMPYAMTLTGVRASVTTAPTGSVLTVDINEGGSTILSTKLTIDATEKTSTTAATPPVISDTSLADDAEITIDIDTVGSTIAGAGLKVWLIGYKTP